MKIKICKLWGTLEKDVSKEIDQKKPLCLTEATSEPLSSIQDIEDTDTVTVGAVGPRKTT